MTVGVIMLVHTDFHRVAQVARHWVQGGCPVVIHVDAKVPRAEFTAFKDQMVDQPLIRFSKRHKCEWGMWGIVAATQDAATLLLDEFGDVRHVYLSSGSCIPLRPVQELVSYLDANADTDFIESATIEHVKWAVDGLEKERFTKRFPFSWRKQRRLFDGYVKLQRKVGFKRRIPFKARAHIGSQWWCLTRGTLEGILNDPNRSIYDRFFKRAWIPDEGYFQTLSRIHSRKLESRSLTLAKFDFQGKPHTFYDDHVQLLRRSDCFVARKIWAGADQVYDSFLRTPETAFKNAEPQPEKIDRLFSQATDRRVSGRKGLTMQSRLPVDNWRHGLTACPYSVFEGFNDLFEGFEEWLGGVVDARVHGNIFHRDRVEFAHGAPLFKGALSNGVALRDYDAKGFLRNMIWNARDEYQCFQFGPDDNQDIHWDLATDPNARVSVISGAWLIGSFKSGADFTDIRKDAAQRQRIQAVHLDALRSPYANAKIQIWSLADFLEAPDENLRAALDQIEPGLGQGLTHAPRMADLSGFADFIQNLKNEGINPYLLGNYHEGDERPAGPNKKRKPYVVR